MRNPTKEELPAIVSIERAERRANLAHQRLVADLGLAVEELRIECEVPSTALLDTATGEWFTVENKDGRQVREQLITD